MSCSESCDQERLSRSPEAPRGHLSPRTAGVVSPVPAGALRSGAPVPVMTRLALVQGTVTASEALELGECTAGNLDIVVFAFDSLTSIEIELEVGSDRENWSQAMAVVFTRGGFARFKFRGIPTRYLRVHYRAVGASGGLGILTTTVNGAES